MHAHDSSHSDDISHQQYPDAHRKGGGKGHHRHRLFDYGELRLLVLAMLEDRPRHGYELIKSIEEQLDGRYAPSPGVIYPTLAWLEDMGYAALLQPEGGRKRYQSTNEGSSFLLANRAALASLQQRMALDAGREPAVVPAVLESAMHDLKHALKQRIRRGDIDQALAERVAVALRAAVAVIAGPQEETA